MPASARCGLNSPHMVNRASRENCKGATRVNGVPATGEAGGGRSRILGGTVDPPGQQFILTGGRREGGLYSLPMPIVNFSAMLISFAIVATSPGGKTPSVRIANSPASRPILRRH